MLSLTLIVGLFAGAAAGAIAMAFLAAAQYGRGYDAAVRRRDHAPCSVLIVRESQPASHEAARRALAVGV